MVQCGKSRQGKQRDRCREAVCAEGRFTMPDQAASDLARLLRHYMTSWQKQRLLLIGYAFGADVLPFLIHRLPADLSRQIDGIALFGLAKTAAFELHLTDWVGVAAAKTCPIAPELSQRHEASILCVSGESETDSLCPTLAPHPGRESAWMPTHRYRFPTASGFTTLIGWPSAKASNWSTARV